MKIRKFRAPDSQTALRQIRQEVGPDAEILASYPVTDGIEFLVSREPVTLESTVLPLNARRGIEALVAAPREPQPLREPVASHERASVRREPVAAAAGRAPIGMPRAVVQAPVASQPAAMPATAATSRPAPADDELLSLRTELGSMRHLLEQHLRVMATGAEPATERTGLQADLRAALATAPQPSLPGEPELQVLGRALPVRRVPTQGVVMLVGPTGAGKTALLTRLLAQAAIAGQAGDVAVINTDVSTPGAGEPLRAYARLLGVRCVEATDADSLATRLAALAACRLVLIDTAGFSRREAGALDALQALQAQCPQAECLLVLPADRERSALEAIGEQALALPLTGLAVTRLDEADRLDSIAALAIRHRLPLTWVSDAPRHPQGVQAARLDDFIARLAQLAGLEAETAGSAQTAATDPVFSRRAMA